jgi:PAS domain-containing protein
LEDLLMANELTYEELEQKVRELEEEAAERKRLEEALDTQRRELISIFDSIDEGVYVCDPESSGLILWVKSVTRSSKAWIVPATFVLIQ